VQVSTLCPCYCRQSQTNRFNALLVEIRTGYAWRNVCDTTGNNAALMERRSVLKIQCARLSNYFRRTKAAVG